MLKPVVVAGGGGGTSDDRVVLMTVITMVKITMIRFEGIYEESRAVFLCNQGSGHRGGRVSP